MRFNKRVIFIFILISIAISFYVGAESETPVGTFTLSNTAPEPAYNWSPLTTHDKNQNFTWTEGYDINGDTVSTYICVTNDTDTDDCAVVEDFNRADPWYYFNQTELYWDYAPFGTPNRTYHVKLTSYDGTANGTANTSLHFNLTDFIPVILGATSNGSTQGARRVGDNITFLMSSHTDRDANDNHSLLVCQTNSIDTNGACGAAEYCSDFKSTYSPENNLTCNYTSVQGDATSNTAYVFICDCPPNDESCPGQCTGSTSVTFYVNHEPNATNVNMTPKTPSSNDNLNCSYTFNDFDSDSDSSTFKWFNWTGSAWITTPYTTQNITDVFESGETWLCMVIPTDEYGFAGNPVNSTNRTIINSAPNRPTNFEVQHGQNVWDSTDYDTHDLIPDLNWTTSDNNTQDTITSYLCVASSATDRDNNNCDINYTGGVIPPIYNLSGFYYNSTINQTYYVRITPNDGIDNGTVLDTQFNVSNDAPNIPSNFLPVNTHNQTPPLNWTGGDADNGSVDGWPADTVTYYLRVGGTDYGNSSYENNNNSDNNSEVIDNTIPWGITESNGFKNRTVYVSLWAGDGYANSTKLNTTINLYDFLPDVLDVKISNVGALYSSCVTATCALNPVEGSNTTVAVKVVVNDTDADCDMTGLTPNMSLCLDTSNCTGITGNYSWVLDSVSRTGSMCNYSFTTNKTAADGTPEFFRLPNSAYKYYVNVTSQSGARLSDLECRGNWTYGTLKAINYSSTVILGNGSVHLGKWNPGLFESVMINFGNDDLNLQWNVTNPDSGSDTWTLNDTDFRIDDDNSTSGETGPIAPVYLNATQKTFEPSSGLQICSMQTCADATINETMSTYFHILPPAGLQAGVYNNTIMIELT